MPTRLAARQEVRFFAALWRAAPAATAAWWGMVLLRGVLPVVVSLAFGWLISAVALQQSLVMPLVVFAVAFVPALVVVPASQLAGWNLGSRMSAHLYYRLTAVCTEPAGVGHLERPDLANDLSMARDFDLGITGPPLHLSMDFIAGGLVELVTGCAAAVVLAWFHWWAPLLLLVGWGSTHWLLRESGVWKDRNTDEVRNAQRHADYAYRMAVEAGPAKELRLFGLGGWVIDRFVATRRRLYDLQYEATKLRERSVLSCLVIVAVANAAVFWMLGRDAIDGDLSAARVVVFVQAALGVGAIAFGGLNWALDGAAAPVVALERLEAAVAQAGTLRTGAGLQPDDQPHEIRFEQVEFGYPVGDRTDPGESRPVLRGIDLVVPAGTSVAIVGQNGAGKTTLAKLVCRLYDPTRGTILVDGVPLADLDVVAWRRHLAAVFQDFVRFELSLRANVAPLGAPDDVIRAALADAGADRLAGGDLDVVLSKAYPDGTDLSGGQWQRIALARALCAVRQGASVVLLDEPTAQLDVRGEAEIFERVLAATRHCTTILVSHRFSTVRLADRICVVDDGRVVEVGSHAELMERGGRYRTMFELQASRFTEVDESGEEVPVESL
ncbi:MAG: ABC transporter ATP-binding protein [Actinomycetota bacterium]|nr:ABC transporter ATP-binding protein [Actinomycetota bacterium]